MRFDRLMEHLIGVLALLVLAGGALIVIAPFVTALLWGAILAYCTWHPFQRLNHAFGGRRLLATLFIILMIFVILLGPVFYTGGAFSTRVPGMVALLQERLASGVSPVPEWVSQLPYVGVRVDQAWEKLVARNPEILDRLRLLARPMLLGTINAALSIAQGLGLLALSVLLAAFFYLSGEKAAAALRASMRHVAGARADYLLELIGSTVKGVVYGILATSLAQAALLTVGYWIVGLPSIALLGLATFFLAIIPGGPLLIIVPAVIWLVHNNQTGWAIFLAVWGLVAGLVISNVLQPILIGRSSNVPFILVMLGVLGGAAAFGLLGVFIGPTLLAVARAVFEDWTSTPVAGQRMTGSMPVPAAGGTA